MTLQELFDQAGRYAEWLMIAFAVAPLAAALLIPFRNRYAPPGAPLKYLYTLLVYAACVPGVFAVVLIAYSLFFTRTSLLEVNLLVYALPVVSMGITLPLLARSARFEDIPGFDHLLGLLVLIGLSFLVALVIAKTRVWLFFGGSIWIFFLLAAGTFVLLKWAARTAIKGRR